MTSRTATFAVDVGCVCPDGHRAGLLGLAPAVRDQHIAAFKRDHPQEQGHRWVDRLPKQQGDPK
jgi:hypothetical protein